jgi:N-methylhydantoinase A
MRTSSGPITGARVAVDIGGTFTDTVLVDGTGTVVASTKTLTDHDNPGAGALEGLRRVVAEAGIAVGDIAGFIHGTTLATNALIERRGATVATITTHGFRDILEIAYERRYDQYDIDIEKPDLIVPRAHCLTVPERLSVTGEVLTPLDEGAVDGIVARLDAIGADAVAVCLLHAYANPAHETRLRALLLDRRPDLAITLSSEVSPEAREFERLCTAVANAYVQPLMAGYLGRFQDLLRAEGLTCPVLMMTASGGMTTLDTAARFPVRLVESGPAGGAVLAARVARRLGAEKVLSFDMGGTTAKLCLIDGYEPHMARRFEIARAARFIKGSGMPVRIPVVEMIEIGAGGGSIAGVDRIGRLTVGPRSAGSTPGPAAYGRGGADATVTDSDLVAGYIDPGAFAEGRIPIDRDLAAAALTRAVGDPLDLDPRGAAEGVLAVVDESMAAAARMHAVESGTALEDRVMIAFGGNGPLHATRVARRAGVRRVVIPRNPSVGSAVGFLFAPISFEIARSRYTLFEGMDLAAVNALLDEMTATAERVVRLGAPEGPLRVARSAFMRYRGQGHEIEVSLGPDALTEADLPALLEMFEASYRDQFARSVPGMTVEILNWSVRVASEAGAPETEAPRETIAVEAPVTASRDMLCDLTGEPVTAAVYHRDALPPGTRVPGPALIVEPQTTTLVSADFTASVDGDGTLILTRTDPLEGEVQ